MRIRDWSSDVCSSDLESAQGPANFAQPIRGCVDGEGIGTRCVQTLLLRLGYRRLHGFDQLAANDHGIGAGGQALRAVGIADTKANTHRSEERRVGKEWSVRVDLGGRLIYKKTNCNMKMNK